MPYDFSSYIADTMLAAHNARNSGQRGSAEMLDADLHFAITDAAKAGQLGDPQEFQTNVAHSLIERGGAGLIDTLIPPKK